LIGVPSNQVSVTHVKANIKISLSPKRLHRAYFGFKKVP
jgi:hypothetical protein